MRYLEITSGVRIPVSGEEQEILSKTSEHGSIARSSLSDREQEIARRMTSRGLLRRFTKDKATHFTANADPTLRRF